MVETVGTIGETSYSYPVVAERRPLTRRAYVGGPLGGAHSDPIQNPAPVGELPARLRIPRLCRDHVAVYRLQPRGQWRGKNSEHPTAVYEWEGWADK